MNTHCFSHFPTHGAETGPPQVKLFHACNLTKLKAATHRSLEGRTYGHVYTGLKHPAFASTLKFHKVAKIMTISTWRHCPL